MVNINKLIEELDNYKNDRKYLLYSYVKERLEKSLFTYETELTKKMKYLSERDLIKISRRLNKL